LRHKSNEHQQLSIGFSITLDLVEHTAKVSFRTNFLNLNVFQALETLEFQKAFATGSWLHIINTATNTPLVKTKIPEQIVSQPPANLIDVASNLSYIQEKTGQIIPWPGTISYDEKDWIDEVVTIINTGIANGGNQFGFSLEKEAAQKLLASISKDGRYNFRIEAQERFVNLFGQKIILGPVSIMLLDAKPNEETLNRLATLNELPDNSLVQIELEVDDPGIKIYHHKWLPSHIKDSLSLALNSEHKSPPS
jgi:hypothetical protein